MKFALNILTTSLSLLIATPAFASYFDYDEANTGLYVKGAGMFNWADLGPSGSNSLEFNTGYGFGAGFGYRFNSGTQIEGEIVYRANELEAAKVHGVRTKDVPNFDLTTTAYMVNIIQNFSPHNSITPYIGFGLGYADHSIKVAIADFKEKAAMDGFAWQIMAGAHQEIADKVELGLEYRFLRATSNLHDHSVTVTVARFF